MNFQIPKTFRLGGRTWKVKRNCRSKKWFGRCKYNQCLIELSTLNRSPEEELHTFLHELMHAIAHAMAWIKFEEDEAKIDGVASLLLQVLESASD